MRAHPFLFTLIAFAATACASSSDPTPSSNTDANTPTSDASTSPSAPATSACKSPRVGRYTVDVAPKTSCWWWDSTRDHADMNILEDAVRYPGSDDLCGDVQWSGCALEDECGPIKFSAGSKGWYGKGSLSVSFTDDEHFTGTVTFDVGDPCLVILEVSGERLDLGG